MKKFLILFVCVGALIGCQHTRDGKNCSYYREKAETPLYFEFGTADILDESKESLEAAVVYLNLHKFRSVQLDGYTDEKGSVKFNDTLSRKRAEKVRDYMLTRGIEEKRISIKWHGIEKGMPHELKRRVDVSFK